MLILSRRSITPRVAPDACELTSQDFRQNMGVATDPHTVGRYDEEHLRRFLHARAQGDATGMRRWWDELVVDFFDRMDGFVAASHRGRLNDEEHELAVQMAMIRFSTNLITTFEGISIGQLVNACKTLARGICMDVQESAARRRKHVGFSLDEGWDAADADDELPPGWETDEAFRRLDADERSRDVVAFLAWAMPKLNEKHRDVLELTFEGHDSTTIAGRLGISGNNADQRRSRGMKDLRKLKEQYDA